MDPESPLSPLPRRADPTPLAELLGRADPRDGSGGAGVRSFAEPGPWSLPAPFEAALAPAPPPERVETPAPVDAPQPASPAELTQAAPAPLDEHCGAFQDQIRADLAGVLAAADLTRLRTHLASCAACRAERRAAVETAAALGRNLRAVSGSAAPRGHTLEGLPGMRGRRSLLLFVTASFVFFMAVRSGAFDGADPRLWLSAQGATVDVAGEQMEPSDAARLLVRGDVVAVGSGARAAIQSPRVRLELFAGRLLVESALGPRVRIVEGEAELEGRVRLITPDGILDLESGLLRVVVGRAGTTLDNRDGKGVWTGPTGQRALERASTVAVRAPGPPPARD